MPKLRNTYGDRAMDLDLDRLSRRVQELEAKLSVLSAGKTTVVTQPASITPPAMAVPDPISFATASKYMTEPALVPAPLSFVNLSKWENG